MRSFNKNIKIGLVFIVIGVFFLLGNFDVISQRFRDLLFQWENILILIGISLLFSKENFRKGIILLTVGIFFSLDQWFNVDINIFDLWPMALVILGIFLITRNSDKGEENYKNSLPFDSDRIDDTVVFSGGDKVINSQAFKGGALTAIFGGSNIDLTQAQLAEGKQVMDVFFVFGGSKIRVPQDWQVEMNVTGIFGGMSDKRRFVDPKTDQPNATKHLYIKGTAIFGGADISN
jgi:predicted membrane protein